MYTLTQIKQMGFTDSIIKTLNIIPTEIKPNPHNKKNFMKLYSEEYIDTMLKSSEFVNLVGKNINRRLGALKSTNTKTEKLLSEIDRIKISVRVVESVEKLAIESYNSHNGYNEYFDYTKEFLDRITVNYIRHELTNYEEDLDLIFGKVGKIKAYELLNTFVYDKIKKAYPEYSEECDRQLKIKKEMI